MVKIYKPKNAKALDKQTLQLTIERLDINGDGVARHQGKPVFVSNALPLEVVEAKVIEQKSKYLRADSKKILTSNAQRVSPECRHFYQCGGCNLQHLEYQAQLDFKQQKVSELFRRNTKLEQLPWQAPLVAKPWHYRRKARIGVQYDRQGQVTLGFRKKQSNVLTPIKQCLVLPQDVSDVFVPLQQVLQKISPSKAIGHCEFIAADRNVLVLRTLKKLPAKSIALLSEFGQQQQLQIILQDEQGISTLDGEDVADLWFQMHGCQLSFSHNDFLQVHGELNATMVQQAISWLALEQDDRVVDLFCGFGNFSVPMAKQCQQLVGVEGVDSMVERAQKNAEANDLRHCDFFQADLNDENVPWPWLEQYPVGHFNKLLLDPARAGAPGAIKRIVSMAPELIVYVSCDAATMSRDSDELLNNGYRLEKIALMDMFAQTRHVETMALFVKNK
ncbi:23S rRNA (uracil(1939)-C(5))-methyltransferase RlmD [Thalassotalea sp. HSM 43]|uniref:23S rRNA (uracil(1939)-C(5))-methyltransferase RlmD n=1 Tax=Thalassotalea sp. HSM 43 TaxID=2552945 RepID=UPI0010807867|nr:23S rRNA (uracil(1939)-C(5))-methyltransferase RlmD [Thalassotalea sp. HSM 43]QBY05083.1 23S rRNA (uracil(1939)-C(5))-methyltransferase RlmD [Thalassotalea sp. HSM 43]